MNTEQKETHTAKVSLQTSHAWLMWMLFNLSTHGGQFCSEWISDFSGKNDAFDMARKSKYELN